MYILGVSCFYHDSAAVLLQDGMLVAAAMEERFSRVKHDSGFPTKAIAFCLSQAGISADDLAYAVFYEKPLVKFERILMSVINTVPRSYASFSESMLLWMKGKLWIKNLLHEKVGVPIERILFVDHHLSHAASTFLASPFEEAAIITMDGVGEWTTAAMGHGRSSWKDGHTELVLSHEQRFPHSLGLLYSTFTAFLGFEVNDGEYKVMGMAPYGIPRYVEDIRRMFTLHEDGSFRLNGKYFSFEYSTDRMFTDRFVRVFGPPRDRDADFFTPGTGPAARDDPSRATENQRYADIAASIQAVTEEAILRMARAVHRRTGSRNLCMAGGVALNSLANGRLASETPFDDVFIQPASGDDGGALGAALYVHYALLGHPRRFVQEHCFWGAAYGEDAMRDALQASGCPWRSLDEDRLVELAVEEILGGRVVGWFQGRFEWGPRALGNRSILADPRRPEMKDLVNAKIKFREPFRPFAPVILEEETARYFPSVKSPERRYPLRFMLEVRRWDRELGEKVPAVNHFGTGRLQTIRAEWNPLYHRLVAAFHDATGIPVLMNTSFNLRGEPIVATPSDALRTFRASGIDTLVMGHFVVRKLGDSRS
jgi:carbamoyltransferase